MGISGNALDYYFHREECPGSEPEPDPQVSGAQHGAEV